MKFNKSRQIINISKKNLVKDLKKIGLKENDHVAVTLSLKSVGYIEGGPNTFIDSLLEVVGSGGTILMNTFTRPPGKLENFPVSKLCNSTYIFDYRSTPCWTGQVPETLRNRKEAIRSQHPVCSVTSIGKYARYLTETHDSKSDLYLPYSLLTEINGKYLCIGIGHRLVAIRHEAQRLAGLSNLVPRQYGVKYRDKNGETGIYVYNQPPCVRELPKLVPNLIQTYKISVGKVGMANSLYGSAKDIITGMTEILKDDPTKNLCKKTFCLWCREAERRLDLYKHIKNPEYFQKNFMIRNSLAIINKIRLKPLQNGESNTKKILLRISWITEKIFHKPIW